MPLTPCLPGIPLRIACKIVGIFQIVASIVEGIIYTLGLVALDRYENSSLALTKSVQDINISFPLPFIYGDEANRKTLIIVFAASLLGALVYGAIGALLIIASKRGDIKLLKIWAVLQSLLIITLLIYMGTTLALKSSGILLNLALDSLSLFFQLYFLWIVYSFIVHLKDEQTLTLSPSIRKSGEQIDLSFPMDKM